MGRDIDIIIFGATGFTGRRILPILYKLSKTHNRSLTWGVAGRSENKLRDVLALYEKQLGTSLKKIPMVVANVEDETSLRAMAAKTRIIINCCGPYQFYGEPVVKACVNQGTHHVDISGEFQFMEEMQLKYHQKAQEKGVYIVSACGLESIPADLGVVYLQQQFSGTLNSVETYLDAWVDGGIIKSIANFATFESAVLTFGNIRKLREIRRQLYPDGRPSFEPKLGGQKILHKSDIAEGWMAPYIGPDRAVVRRSQRYFYEHDQKRPIQIQTYIKVKSLFYVFLSAFYGFFLLCFAQFDLTRKLLFKYPELFTNGICGKEPPSEETMKRSAFSVTFHGKGWKESLANPNDKYTTPPDQVIIGRVQGRNPGYGFTCVCVTLAAIVIITETIKLPPRGGVYAPGAAFAKTTLIKQLSENDVKFEILAMKDLPSK